MSFFTSYQKLATAALISVILLIFVGAIVRVTGAGMGCPDWPTCWGKLIPPTKIEQVDFEKLNIEKFQKKAAKMGRDPSLISQETLRVEFHPRHIWTEFINRLLSLPVGFFTLATFIASFAQRKNRPQIFIFSFIAFLLVLTNAWMGARVVFSGISSGVLSIHLALAMSLICVLTYCAWAGVDQPSKLKIQGNPKPMRITVFLLLSLIIVEGILGTEIREITDTLAKRHLNIPREAWIQEIEQNLFYLIHRSLSWALLAAALLAYFLARRQQTSGANRLQSAVIAIMFIQMILGIVMAHVSIYAWTQLLHVGLAAVLLSLVFRWLLMIPKKENDPI